MFILELIPDNIIIWVTSVFIIIGIIGIIVENAIYYIPGLLPYRILIKTISNLVLMIGVFIAGSYITELVWKERVAEVQKRVAIAEEKSHEVNTVIQEKVINQIKVVEKRVIVNRTIIQKQQHVINAECKIPEIAFKIYNTSVLGGTNE